jgi:predicted NBD/HSP70 family sugar kinase
MKKLAGKPQMLKEVNSSMIEQLVYERGPLSKPDLVKLTSLSLPTVSKLVDTLEQSARLSHAGRTEKGAGRKATLYETNRNSGCMLILYYTLGKYRCRIVDMLSDTLYETVLPLDHSSSQKVKASTLNAIDILMEHAPTKVKVIGIGMPGVVKPDGCLLGIPQIASLEGCNLEKLLTASYKVGICVENNVNLAAVGYYNRLREKQNNMVYIYAGNGIGAGLIINRELYRGSANFSGEIGFMVSGRIGHDDYIIHGGEMETHWRKFVNYAGGDFQKEGDPGQREAAIDSLSIIAANCVAILNPEVIVFGGPIFNQNLIDGIKRRVVCYIPKGIMPRFMYDHYDNTGLEGLILTCRNSITTGTQLVQNSGGARREAS